jgi:hypothetical protein
MFTAVLLLSAGLTARLLLHNGGGCRTCYKSGALGERCHGRELYLDE